MRATCHNIKFSPSFILITCFILSEVLPWAPSYAACFAVGDTLNCSGLETNGAIGSNILVLSNATVQLNDPFAGGTPRLETVSIASGGQLTTQVQSIILDTGVGGAAVTLGAGAVFNHSGTVQGYRNNAPGIVMGAGAMLTVKQGAFVEASYSGNGNPLQVAAVTAAGNGSIINIDGIVQGQGSGSAAIRPLQIDAFGNTHFYTANITVGATGQARTFSNAANATAIAVNGGSNVVINGIVRASGTGSSAITYQAGSATDLSIIINQSGSVISDQSEAIIGEGADLKLTVAGTVIGGSASHDAIALGSGDDQVENRGAVFGNILLGSGDDSLTHSLAATFQGTADGGAGVDELIFDLDPARTFGDSILAKFTNFENLGFTGTGAISISGAIPVTTLNLNNAAVTVQAGSTLQTSGPVALTGDAGTEHVINYGTIAGDVILGDGADGFENAGAVIGQIDLGNGDDRYDYHSGSIVTGGVLPGAGSDLLALHLSGSTDAPEPINLAPFADFKRLALEDGVGSVSGTISRDSLIIDGGRLIGLPGSLITTANGITVGSGGAFGSAGTVNSNVTVSGTLSPGASPGTMTVNGNVTLASGSITLLEMTSTVSDALVINGALTIAGNTSLNITGARPLTPGLAYDLIIANDGISGSFTTINKAAGVIGFVRQSPNALQLLGQFQLQGSANPQVSATVDYVNSLLISGTASAGLLAAVPSLLDSSGFANPTIFARLNPEPYASASQIGMENGLAISNALRGVTLAANGDRTLLFGFGQGLGAWRRLRGSPTLGVSSTNIRSSGVLGGVGFGSQQFSIAAFVGRIDAAQHISTLGASTDSGGTIAGVIGRANLANLEFAMSASWDGSSADTKRNLIGGTITSSHYRLSGWTVDATTGYRIALGDAMTVGPEIGFTHIASRRGRAMEGGAGAFNLDVASKRTEADFLSGLIELAATTAAGVRPWISVGLRYQLSGNINVASASFGNSGTDTLEVRGAKGNPTLAIAKGGFEVKFSKQLIFFVNGHTEFGAGSSGKSANAGFGFNF